MPREKCGSTDTIKQLTQMSSYRRVTVAFYDAAHIPAATTAMNFLILLDRNFSVQTKHIVKRSPAVAGHYHQGIALFSRH